MEEMDNDPNAALHPPVRPERMFGTCGTCKIWEGRLGLGCEAPLLGYCSRFNKLTKHTHGKRCTAFTLSP